MYDYLRHPADIYRRSFELIREEAPIDSLPEGLRDIAVRLVHACGMPDIVPALVWQGAPRSAALDALQAGAPILVDTRMVAMGILADRLPARNPVICTLGEVPAVADRAARPTTRSAAAVDLWRPDVAGAVVAIGNAPTALFRLLEILAEDVAPPAAIFAFPVGFVGAAEAKQALVDAGLNTAVLTLLGRRGGSAMAAAAINALVGRETH